LLVRVILFTYRRVPDKTIESLLKNSLAKESELFIFSDGYKNEIDKKDVLEVRQYLKTIDGFKNISIYESRKNKGLANSIIAGVTKIINEYEKVIVLEDDLIVSSDFLDYMNEALAFYKDDKKIWSISGYTPNLKCLKDYDKDVYLSVRANSWGWATWKDRWDSIDWEIKDWKEFKKDKKAVEKFNLGGNDMYKMLELQMLGKIDSWAIRWCYNQFKQNKYTVYPKYSKIINNGFADEKAQHNSGQKWDKFDVALCNKKLRFEKISIVNKQILKEFKDLYSIGLYTKIGYFLKKHGGYDMVKKVIKGLKNVG